MGNSSLRQWTAAVVLAAGVQSPALSVTLRTFGPFDVQFFGSGEASGSFSSNADWTEEQIADVGHALTAWDNVIANEPGRQLDLRLFWNDFTGGWVYSNFGSNPLFGQYGIENRNAFEVIWRDGDGDFEDPWSLGYHVALRIQNTPTGSIESWPWNFGSDAPGPDEWDFRTIMLHEFGHAMGFVGVGTENGFFHYAPTRYDYLRVDAEGDRPRWQSYGTPGDFDENGIVYWTGSEANALHGGPIPMQFSSQHVYLTPFGQSIMASPGQFGLSYNGEVLREPTALDRAFLRDLGWTVVDPRIIGDYDGDEDVDGADFLEWQRQFGSEVTALSGADGNGDGVVNAADYVVWRDNFGTGGGGSQLSVPEPRAGALLGPLLGLAVATLRVRGGRHLCRSTDA